VAASIRQKSPLSARSHLRSAVRHFASIWNWGLGGNRQLRRQQLEGWGLGNLPANQIKSKQENWTGSCNKICKIDFAFAKLRVHYIPNCNHYFSYSCSDFVACGSLTAACEPCRGRRCGRAPPGCLRRAAAGIHAAKLYSARRGQAPPDRCGPCRLRRAAAGEVRSAASGMPPQPQARRRGQARGQSLPRPPLCRAPLPSVSRRRREWRIDRERWEPWQEGFLHTLLFHFG
jgi:hypothetical protein